MKYALMGSVVALLITGPLSAGPRVQDGGFATTSTHGGLNSNRDGASRDSGDRDPLRERESKDKTSVGGGGGVASTATAAPSEGLLSDLFVDIARPGPRSGDAHGAPGPEMGAGLPIIVIAGAAYWMVRRVRRRRLDSLSDEKVLSAKMGCSQR
jgi:hypothetical protein